MSDTKLPLFPLPIFILPNGIARLRIIEPRYLKMVKIAAQQQGFVIRLTTDDIQESDLSWGSWVEIINFNLGKDGVLELDVQCQNLVTLSSIEEDTDKLQFANVNVAKHWSQELQQTNNRNLFKPLYDLFRKDSLLADLYKDMPKQNANWVVARWLELLPVTLNVKKSFIQEQSFEQAKQFVQSIIFK